MRRSRAAVQRRETQRLARAAVQGAAGTALPAATAATGKSAGTVNSSGDWVTYGQLNITTFGEGFGLKGGNADGS